jgi:hypothetical protein
VKIKITSSDLLKNVPLDPDWYEAVFVKMETAPSKDRKSTNFVVHIQIDKDGRVIEHLFNSKAMGFMQPFVDALILGPNEHSDANCDLEFDDETCKGKKLKVHTFIDTYMNRPSTKIDGFSHIETDTSPAF